MSIRRIKSIILAVMFALVATGCQKQPDSPSADGGTARTTTDSATAYPKRYLIESGVIEYELTGPQAGTETVYFDKWGWREAKYTNTALSVAGISRKENRLSIMDGDWIYSIDLANRTGTKIQNTLLPQFVAAAKRKDQNMTQLGEEMLSNMGGKKAGTEEVAGKSCDVWETKSLGSRSWVWRGVTLKTQVNMGGMQITTTARRFGENAAISADKFALPSDVTITEGQDVKRVLEGIREKTKGR